MGLGSLNLQYPLFEYAQISDCADSALLLAGGECYCEDSYLIHNGQVAVRCLGGDELVALRHCDLRSKTRCLIDGADSALVYTSMCATDPDSEAELRQYPWYERLSPRRTDSAEALGNVAEKKVRKRARDE